MSRFNSLDDALAARAAIRKKIDITRGVLYRLDRQPSTEVLEEQKYRLRSDVRALEEDADVVTGWLEERRSAMLAAQRADSLRIAEAKTGERMRRMERAVRLAVGALVKTDVNVDEVLVRVQELVPEVLEQEAAE